MTLSAETSPLFCEVDGLLVDPLHGHWRLHRILAAELGIEPVEESVYRELRRAGASVEEITGLEGRAADAYRRRRVKLAGLAEFAPDDVPVPSASLALKLVRQARPVAIFGLRRDAARSRAALKALGYSWDQSLFGIPKEPAARALARLLESSPFFDRHAIVAAGTEPGVRAALSLGVTTVAVLGPLLDERGLSGHDVEAILESAAELPSVCRKLIRS